MASQRRIALSQSHHTLYEMIRGDERIEAHIDGLRIAVEGGQQACQELVNQKLTGSVFAIAVLTCERRHTAGTAEVIAVSASDEPKNGELISALGWLDYEKAQPHIAYLLRSDSPVLRRVGIGAAAVHRQDPGRPLDEAATDPDFFLRARALKAVGELGRSDLLGRLRQNLDHPDDECRYWAAWSAALLGDWSVVQHLKSYVASGGPRSEEAVNIGIRCSGLQEAHAWQAQLAAEETTLRLAIKAAGATGDPEFVPWLIHQMRNAPFARPAGEAFTMITGVDLAYADLDADKPEGFESGPTEDPNDDNVAMDPDENLPWPAPDLISNWWAQHQQDFKPGVRYLIGQPIGAEWLFQVLRTGRQRQRAAAALELVMIAPGQPLFNVAAPGFRQRKMLGLPRF